MATIISEQTRGIEIRYDSASLLGATITPESTHEERLAAGRAIGAFMGASEPMDHYMKEIVSVVGVLCHPAEYIDQNTGEVKNTIRTVFVLADGKRLSSLSGAIVRFVESQLLPLFTRTGNYGNLTGPVKIKLAAQMTRGGKNTYAPEIVG